MNDSYKDIVEEFIYDKLKGLEFVDNIKEEEKDDIYLFLEKRDLIKNNFCGLSLDNYVDSNIKNINYNDAYFSLEKWNIMDIAKVFPEFGEIYCNNVKKEFVECGLNPHNAMRWKLTSYTKYWDVYKTYEIPIVIIAGEDFPEAKIKTPYQLFEGHTRLGWIKAFADNFDENKVRQQHYVIVLRRKKET